MGCDDVTGCSAMGIQSIWGGGLFFFCFCLERVMRRENSTRTWQRGILFLLGWERRRRRILHQIVATDTASAVHNLVSTNTLRHIILFQFPTIPPSVSPHLLLLPMPNMIFEEEGRKKENNSLYILLIQFNLQTLHRLFYPIHTI